MSLATFNGGSRPPRRLASRRSMGTLSTSLLSCGEIHRGQDASYSPHDGAAATVALHS